MSQFDSPNPEAPVLVIGAAGVDMVGRVRGKLNLGSSSAAAIRTSFGGVARNVAENLARLGQPVRLLTAIGADLAGDQLLEQAEAAGVDVDGVLRLTDWPTSTYLAVLNPRGELQIALDDMRAIQAVSSEYLRRNAGLFQEASMLFLDANLSRDTLRTAVSLAKKARLPICANPVATSLAHRLVPYLPHLSLVTPNLEEAAVLAGMEPETAPEMYPEELAKKLVTLGVETAIITLAEFGVCYATSETSGQVPAIRTEILEPTGAGDALTAAVMFAMLNEIPIDDAVRLGVSAATLTLRYPSTVLPDLSLEKLYDQLVI
jgi:pseudouridine kinase